MDPQVKKKVVERIQKLLRMAEGKANHFESATAARQAEALMRKFNLDMRDVILEDLKSKDSIVGAWSRAAVNMGASSYHKRVPHWAQWIATACAQLFDCYACVVKLPTAGKVVQFIGYTVDVEVCKWTFDYLVNEIRRLSKDYIAAVHADTTEADAYRNGITIEVRLRLMEQLEEKQRAADRGKGKDLVAAKKQALEEALGGPLAYLDSDVARLHDKLTKASVETQMSYIQGRRDGKRVRLTPNPVEHKPTQPKGLLK